MFGDYNMLIFRSEQAAQSLTDTVGAAKLLTSSALPEFFNGESAWRDGVPFSLNTHDHKLVPKPLGGRHAAPCFRVSLEVVLAAFLFSRHKKERKMCA